MNGIEYYKINMAGSLINKVHNLTKWAVNTNYYIFQNFLLFILNEYDFPEHLSKALVSCFVNIQETKSMVIKERGLTIAIADKIIAALLLTRITLGDLKFIQIDDFITLNLQCTQDEYRLIENFIKNDLILYNLDDISSVQDDVLKKIYLIECKNQGF
jgi:hypothetical protein